MKATWIRINVITFGLLLVGAWAWINAIASLLITSEMKVSVELILLFVGMRLLHKDGRRARYALSLLILAGIVVILIPVAAFTISPTVTVSLFGAQYSQYSYVSIGFVITVTVSYLATIAWLYMTLRKDLQYEDPAKV